VTSFPKVSLNDMLIILPSCESLKVLTIFIFGPGLVNIMLPVRVPNSSIWSLISSSENLKPTSTLARSFSFITGDVGVLTVSRLLPFLACAARPFPARYSSSTATFPLTTAIAVEISCSTTVAGSPTTQSSTHGVSLHERSEC